MSEPLWPKPVKPKAVPPPPARGTEILDHLDLLTKAVAAFRTLAEQSKEARDALAKTTRDLEETTKGTIEEPLQRLTEHIWSLDRLAEAGDRHAGRTGRMIEEMTSMADTLQKSLEKVTKQLTENLKANAEAVQKIAAAGPPGEPRAAAPGPDTWSRIQVVVTGRDYQDRIEMVELTKMA
jgi:hypothetical protein